MPLGPSRNDRFGNVSPAKDTGLANPDDTDTHAHDRHPRRARMSSDGPRRNLQMVGVLVSIAVVMTFAVGLHRLTSSDDGRGASEPRSNQDRVTWQPLTAPQRQLLFSREVVDGAGAKQELTVETTPAQRSIFGPYGAASFWTMPDGCRLTEFSVQIGSFGRWVHIPVGGFNAPLAVRARAIQTEESTMNPPLRGRQVVLVFPDRPGLRYEALFPDGSRDHWEAGDERVVALIGGKVTLDSEVQPTAKMPTVTASGPGGIQLWEQQAADAQRSIEDPDPRISGGVRDPGQPTCQPPSPETIGTAATPEVESAVRITLQTLFGQEAPPDSGAAQVFGWTDGLGEALSRLRTLAIGQGYTWTVEAETIRMLGVNAWARVTAPGTPLLPTWVELVTDNGRWRVTTQSACLLTQMNSATPNMTNC